MGQLSRAREHLTLISKKTKNKNTTTPETINTTDGTELPSSSSALSDCSRSNAVVDVVVDDEITADRGCMVGEVEAVCVARLVELVASGINPAVLFTIVVVISNVVGPNDLFARLST